MTQHHIHPPHDPTTTIATRTLSTLEEAQPVLAAASTAFEGWRATPLERRIELCRGLVERFLAGREEVARELAALIGRPLKHCHNELNGFEERATHLLSIATQSLADTPLPPKPGFTRFIRREPHGPILIISAWNYPYLITVNGVLPALLAGNTVILKQAPQTLLCAERIVKAGTEAGLPEGVLQFLHADHGVFEGVIGDRRIRFVQFTGSGRGGREVGKVLAGRCVGLGLELGGKDPTYVREDADPTHAAENLIDGAMYNSGQSCCAVERIYVHEKVYDRFVEEAVRVASEYRLGMPFDPETTLGPVVGVRNAEMIREHVKEAVEKGAKALVDPSLFPVAQPGTAFVAPQVLVDVDHTMKIMREETFGPVVGVMKVRSDEEAIKLMNDSEYGLTASVWTKDDEAGMRIVERLEAGTVFMNRCDYLDPALPWSGCKDSGRGVTLSSLGFEALTRPKSFHLRHDKK
ncbi:hypothetical protein HDU67_004488 [Dinochytrium kinnereticum]|nr:hypothetical protein HDU67_004488 [Dinochytrium kinnereticum]